MTFAFLPLLGMSQAMQAVIGNNIGAGLWQRSARSLRLGIATAFVYCLAVEILLMGLSQPIGSFFVGDAAVVDDVARIMPVMVAMFFLSGPLMMIGTHFQAMGDARRAAILGLSKPYLFTIPQAVVLASTLGERGIWLATPIAEILLLVVAVSILWQTARQRSAAWALSPLRREEAK